MTTAVATARGMSARAAAAMLPALALAVAAVLGVYAKAHTPAGRPIFTLWFSGMLQMKAWLTTAAVLLVLVQLGPALGMWGRLPGVSSSPASVPVVHRWSGAVAFLLTIPVAV